MQMYAQHEIGLSARSETTFESSVPEGQSDDASATLDHRASVIRRPEIEGSNQPWPSIIGATQSGEPWPANAEKTFARLRPGETLEILRNLHVRQQVFRPAPLQTSGQVPALAALLRAHSRNGSAQSEITPAQLVRALRAQFAIFTANLSLETRRKLDHVFQVQLQPRALRLRMGRFWGMTFIPSRRLGVFPVPSNPDTSAAFIELGDLFAQTLTVRPHTLRDGTRIDMFDVKLHRFEVDPESGLVYVGGSGQYRDRRRFSRCALARYFNYTPFRGAHDQILSSNHVPIVDGAMCMHQAMEMAAVQGMCVRDQPEFPRVYLGFPRPDTIDFEQSPALEHLAFRAVDRWFRLDANEGGWLAQWLRQAKRKLRYPGRSWTDVARQLGDEDARSILMHVWDSEEISHEGLTLLPLEFFNFYSEQRPVRKAIRVFARMDPWLFGREMLRVLERSFRDTKGNALTRLDTVTETELALAKPQVLRAGGKNALVRTHDGFDYDFTAVPLHTEAFFQAAG